MLAQFTHHHPVLVASVALAAGLSAGGVAVVFTWMRSHFRHL
jgi:hypothetical protein